MSDFCCMIGVDVGGTNTDAVVLRGREVLAWSKQPTTFDITSGLVASIRTALAKYPDRSLRVQQINIGTTHFVNAVVQRSSQLARVAVIRLATPPCTAACSPFADFPQSLKTIVDGGWSMISGGYEFDGTEIGSVDTAEVEAVVKKHLSLGVTDFVISGVFSPAKTDQEVMVGQLIDQLFPEASYTLSSDIGTIGLLERENASILNQSLKRLCQKTVTGLQKALSELALECPLYLTQNDGSICKAETALKFPVFTFASGPTNSMRGAAWISGVEDGIVVDIGGTSTDVGVLMKGFPKQAGSYVHIGGVRTNFRMPDTLSIGLGGGSLVKYKNSGSQVSVGPQSVGYRLTQKALCFGGDILTATDLAVASNLIQEISASKLIQPLDAAVVQNGLDTMKESVESAIDRVKTSQADLPVVLVGGGSILIDRKAGLKGCSNLVVCDHSSVANAIGAALCQVSGHVDIVRSVDGQNREKSRSQIVAEAKSLALQAAVQNGADEETVNVVDFEELPLSYLPGNAIQLKGKAVGSLKVDLDKSVLVNWDLLTAADGDTLGILNSDDSSEEPITFASATAGELEFSGRAVGKPDIDSITGLWTLSETDVECIALGAGILGCGGGGNPHVGKVRLLQAMRAGGVPKVLSLSQLNEMKLSSERENGKMIITCAFMGAPLIFNERVAAGNENLLSVKTLAMYTKGLLNDLLSSLPKSTFQGVTYVSLHERDLPKISDDWLRQNVLLMPIEIGGVNSTEPLAVGTAAGIPVVDGDLMGRAYPELHMVTPGMYGQSIFPSAYTIYNGSIKLLLDGPNNKALEDCARMLCVHSGCSASWVQAPLSPAEVLKYAIPNSLSRAWILGRDILTARSAKLDCVHAALATEHGRLLAKGKISDTYRSTQGGFNRGYFVMVGLGDYENIQYVVEFQNENLIVKKGEEVLATTPDLICVIETDTGESISTDILRYGLRISLTLIPPSPLLSAPEGLAVIGPRALGYDLDYQTTFSNHIEAKSIFDIY